MTAARPAASPRALARLAVRIRTSLRVTRRELSFFQKTWKGVSFTMFVAPSLYLVALGVGLGGMIDEQVVDLGGLDYLSFVVPGLAVAGAVQIAGGSALWPVMAGHRWIGFHRAMVNSPIDPHAIVSGYLLWLAARSTAQASVVLAVGAALGGVHGWWALLAPPAAGLAAAALAAPLMAYTATCDSDKAFDPLMRVVVTPLYLFSGTFFPVDRLPEALAWGVRLFPLWHGIELARALSTGTGPTWPPVASLAVVLAWAGGGWWAAQRTFTERLTP